MHLYFGRYGESKTQRIVKLDLVYLFTVADVPLDLAKYID
jgi:hypothetical protein